MTPKSGIRFSDKVMRTQNAMSDMPVSPRAYLQSLSRWRPIEIIFWLATLLPFWMVPSYLALGLGLILHDVSNSASWLTGGSDCLQGVSVWKVAGLFRFDLYGTTAYGYALGVLFVMFLMARRLVNSPFGLALRGIRENFVRKPAIGADSRAHIRKIYTISAAMAGIAGEMV